MMVSVQHYTVREINSFCTEIMRSSQRPGSKVAACELMMVAFISHAFCSFHGMKDPGRNNRIRTVPAREDVLMQTHSYFTHGAPSVMRLIGASRPRDTFEQTSASDRRDAGLLRQSGLGRALLMNWVKLWCSWDPLTKI